MIIFQYFITVFVNCILSQGIYLEFHLLFISLPRTRYFRQNYFLIKNFAFPNFYPFRPTYTIFQPYWKICEFLKSQILKNQCANIVSGTESDISPFTSHLFLRDFQSIDFLCDIILCFVIAPILEAWKHLPRRLFFNKFVKKKKRKTKERNKRHQHRCFTVSFAGFLRTPYLQNTSEWFLLHLL